MRHRMLVGQGSRFAIGSALITGLLLAGCGGDDGIEGPGGVGGLGGVGGNIPAGTGGVPPTGVTCGMTTCAVGQQCVMDVCRMPCMMDTECVGGSCCTGFCAMTQSDRANCGACGKACMATESCSAGACMATMCMGTPGEPIDPSDEDAGVSDDDAGAPEEGPVFGSNGCAPNEQCTDTGMGPGCHCGTGASCPLDQECSTGGMCACGAGPGCAMAEGCCSDQCVKLQTDNANCGSCGTVCGGGSTCRMGACACPNAGERVCGDVCVSTMTDEANCGGCGKACATGATCTGGVCACDTDGHIPCDGVCVDGESEINCGTCGNDCETPTTCTDPPGTLPLGCYCPNFNHVPCNGACVMLGTEQNCGACDDACVAPTSECNNRVCGCPVAGETVCGDHCVNLDNGETGTSPIEDCGRCGMTCNPGATCNSGECSCPGNLEKFCDEDPSDGTIDDMYMCIDVTGDYSCGTCGTTCLGASACAGTGTSPANYDCECTDAAFTHCSGVGCVDLDVDRDHCSRCGMACPAGESCCGGDCLNLQTDVDNCGRCGNDCPRCNFGFTPGVCRAGACGC